MKEEARTLSIAYFRATYTRAILLLYAACEKLTVCSFSGTFSFCMIGYWGLSLMEESRAGWLLAGDSGDWRSKDTTKLASVLKEPVCSAAQLS